MKNALLYLLLVLFSFGLQAQKPEISYLNPPVMTAGTTITTLKPVNSGGIVSIARGQVTTVAGKPTSGLINGTGPVARFNNPTSVAVDKSGNLFVTDRFNHAIRKISSTGVVSTFAGTGSVGWGDGQGTTASFYSPAAVVIDKEENLYISDQYNMKIRKISKTGLVTTYAGSGYEESFDGPALTACFRRPEGMVFDSIGNLYVTEWGGNTIRKISPSNNVSTLAGSGNAVSLDGQGSLAGFNGPCSVCMDPSTRNLFVAEQAGNKIRKVTPSGQVSTIAGTGTAGSTDGPALLASFNAPSGIVLDVSGNLLVADRSNNRIRMISPEGMVSTLAGSSAAGSVDGRSDSARFYFPYGMAFDLEGNLLIADRYNHQIRKLELWAYAIQPALPLGLDFDTRTGIISGTPKVGLPTTTFRIIAKNETGQDTTNLMLTIQGVPNVHTGAISTITQTSAICQGTLISLGLPNTIDYGFCWNTTGNPTIQDSILKMVSMQVEGPFSLQLSNLKKDQQYYIRAFATNPYGTMYGNVVGFKTLGDKPILDYPSSSQFNAGEEISTIFPILTGGAPTSNEYSVSTFAGSGLTNPTDGFGAEAGFNYPMGIAVDRSGFVYVVDRHNNKIRKISPYGKVTTLAGSGVAGSKDGKGVNASFNWPYGIDLDEHGNAFVADRYNNKIRKITPEGIVTTLAGSGEQGSTDGVGANATFNWPTSVALDSVGNVFVADSYNNKIRKITPNGVVTTVAGSGLEGAQDGTALAASFNLATGVELDNQGAIWVADVNNNMIRKIATSGQVSTVAGTTERRYADGVGSTAGFFFPYGLIMDPNGDFLVADANNNRVRKVTKDGVVTTIAGSGREASTDGIPTVASFNYPADLAYDSIGNIFVADAENHKIRKIAPLKFSISPPLPMGLQFDVATGVISGKSLKGSPMTIYTILTSNASGQDTAQMALTIQDTPAVTTQQVTKITSRSATGNGILVNVGSPVPTSFGICWSTSGVPTVDSLKSEVGKVAVAGSYTSTISNLMPNTHYVARAFAISVLGTSYGDTVCFTTPGPAPEISYSVNEQIDTAGVETSPLMLNVTGGTIMPYSLVSTFAGNGKSSSQDGSLTTSSFCYPFGIAKGKSGAFYVSDSYTNTIRQITPDGMVKTLAGNGQSGEADGPAANASFNNPQGIAVDQSENVYVVDGSNLKIRKISKDGNVSTIAGSGFYGSDDGVGAAARFYGPSGIAIDRLGNLFVADYNGNKIRKITPSGLVTTVAGSGSFKTANGTGAAASFYGPMGIAVDSSGVLFVTEGNGNKIRKITPDGVVTTLAGNDNSGAADGIGTNATFSYPTGILIDSTGTLYVTERSGNKIRKITQDGSVTTLAGTGNMGSTDGLATTSTFNNPSGICMDEKGDFYVTDQSSNKIRKISKGHFVISPNLPAGLNFDVVTGTISGKPTNGAVFTSYSITASNEGGKDTATLKLTVLGKPSVSTVSVISITSKTATVNWKFLNLGSPNPTNYGVCWNKTGMPILSDTLIEGGTSIGMGSYRIGLTNLIPGSTYFIRAFATNSYGTSYGEELSFVTPEVTPNIQYQLPNTFTVGTEISPLFPKNSGGNPSPFNFVTTLSGNGTSVSADGEISTACFANPSSIASDTLGNLFITDAYSNKIRKISVEGIVSTLAGNGTVGAIDGLAESASFNNPRGITVDGQGNVIVADTYNHKIRKISKDGMVSTLAGSGSIGSNLGAGVAASFNFPMGLTCDAYGNIYVADKENNRICKITQTGVVTIVAGTGSMGDTDGIADSAIFNIPTGVTVDAQGAVYVADYGNNKIRKISSTGIVTTLAGSGLSGQIDGIGASASFKQPMGISMGGEGNLYVSEYGNNKIRKVTTSGEVSTFAGRKDYSGFLDGKSTTAQFLKPYGVTVNSDGKVFVADFGNNRIRKIAPAFFSISPSLPSGMTFDHVTGAISGKPTAVTGISYYNVTSSNTGGTNSASLLFSVVKSTVDLLMSGDDNWSVYPNPTSGQICIKGLQKREMMTIFTVAGVKVLSKEISNEESIDVSPLKAGVYLLKIGGKDFKLMKK